MRYAPNDQRTRGARKGRPAMKNRNIDANPERPTKGAKRRELTIGLDLGDKSSRYCILDREGEVLVEHRDDEEGANAGVRQPGRQSHRVGGGNALAVGQAAVGDVEP